MAHSLEATIYQTFFDVCASTKVDGAEEFRGSTSWRLGEGEGIMDLGIAETKNDDGVRFR